MSALVKPVKPSHASVLLAQIRSLRAERDDLVVAVSTDQAIARHLMGALQTFPEPCMPHSPSWALQVQAWWNNQVGQALSAAAVAAAEAESRELTR